MQPVYLGCLDVLTVQWSLCSEGCGKKEKAVGFVFFNLSDIWMILQHDPVDR